MNGKKKVFISGPMSGIKDFNKPAFDKAEAYLTQAGFSVFNPARMHFDDAWTHEEIMRIDLAALSQCDYILMLAGFEASIGAMQEYRYAMATGIEMFRMSDIEHPRRVQRCSGCKYFMLGVDEEPCKSCKPVLYSNFESKPTPDAPKKIM